MKDCGKYWAGRLRFFLSHTLPGVDVADDSDVLIAHVMWYAHVPVPERVSKVLNCPVFKASFKDDSNGNMCLLKSLLHASFQLCIAKTAEIVSSS